MCAASSASCVASRHPACGHRRPSSLDRLDEQVVRQRRRSPHHAHKRLRGQPAASATRRSSVWPSEPPSGEGKAPRSRQGLDCLDPGACGLQSHPPAQAPRSCGMRCSAGGASSRCATSPLSRHDGARLPPLRGSQLRRARHQLRYRPDLRRRRHRRHRALLDRQGRDGRCPGSRGRRSSPTALSKIKSASAAARKQLHCPPGGFFNSLLLVGEAPL